MLMGITKKPRRKWSWAFESEPQDGFLYLDHFTFLCQSVSCHSFFILIFFFFFDFWELGFLFLFVDR
jgi:hypothetical protein